MEPKTLILLSLAAIVLVSGCAQLGLPGTGGSRCAKGNIETIDADGSLSAEDDIDKADLKRCFVRFRHPDNIYAVVQEDGAVVSIYKDLDGDKIFSEASDKNILTAQEGDEGTNAADLEDLFYNDIEKTGKYVNLLPAGEASDFVVAAPDIGLLSSVPAFCGDGKLNQPTEECDPPAAGCQNNGICEAGKCKCAAAGSGVEPVQAAEGSGGTASGGDGSGGAEEPSGQKVRLSLVNKMDTDITLSKFKTEFNSDSENPSTCGSLSLTIPSGSSKTLALSLKSTGEISSFANVIKSFEIKKAEDELRIGAASATAGSTDAAVSEIKIESPADKRSTTCKPENDYTIEKKQTHLVDLIFKSAAKTTPSIASPSPGTSPATKTLKPSTSPQASGAATASPGASASPGSATASGSPSAQSATTSKTPTPSPTASSTTSVTPTPTPTPTTSSAGTCSTGAIPAGGCTCGSTLQTSGYCCSGTWQLGSCPSSTPSPCPVGSSITSATHPSGCTCGSQTITLGYCCFNPCSNSYSTSGASCPATCSPSRLDLCNNQNCCTLPANNGNWCSDSICRSSCTNP